MPKSLVAIVGRPNVGKSTLFNRILGKKRAVVSDIPGTTRDRLIADTEWNQVPFALVDTGGIEILPATVEAGRRPAPTQPLLEDSDQYIPMIRGQAEQAIENADVILFLTDVVSGLTAADREVATLLRQTEKPVLLVVNKVDNDHREMDAMEFYELGMGNVHTISAIHGYGLGDLLDEVVSLLPPSEPEPEYAEDAARVAILGRPNVGKSSLLNRLLGEERAIVSPVAGTTRDAIDTEMTWQGRSVVLIDTAGIRRRGKIQRGVEYYSVLRAARALRRTDVALVLIDATEGITAQDTHIAGMIDKAGVSAIVVVNKWDAISPEKRKDRATFEAQVREDLKFMSYVPVLFISALTGWHTQQVLPLAFKVAEARYQRLSTTMLNQVIQQSIVEHAPPSKRGKRLKIYYATQPGVAPPVFVFFVNDARLVHFSYERYLENRIREAYPYPGTPIRLIFRGHKETRRGNR